jgi:small subunit ribosomal protein S20
MPNLDSAKKELRKGKKLAAYNKKIKDQLKTLTKKSRKAIDAKDEAKATELVNQTLKALDKAAQKAVIKKNTRDRKKSRLHQKLNSLKNAK